MALFYLLQNNLEESLPNQADEIYQSCLANLNVKQKKATELLEKISKKQQLLKGQLYTALEQRKELEAFLEKFNQ